MVNELVDDLKSNNDTVYHNNLPIGSLNYARVCY